MRAQSKYHCGTKFIPASFRGAGKSACRVASERKLPRVAVGAIPIPHFKACLDSVSAEHKMIVELATKRLCLAPGHITPACAASLKSAAWNGHLRLRNTLSCDAIGQGGYILASALIRCPTKRLRLLRIWGSQPLTFADDSAIAR